MVNSIQTGSMDIFLKLLWHRHRPAVGPHQRQGDGVSGAATTAATVAAVGAGWHWLRVSVGDARIDAAYDMLAAAHGEPNGPSSSDTLSGRWPRQPRSHGLRGANSSRAHAEAAVLAHTRVPTPPCTPRCSCTGGQHRPARQLQSSSAPPMVTVWPALGGMAPP